MKFNSADGFIPNTAESLFGQGGDESFFSLLQYDEFLRDAFGESIITSPASGWEGTQAIGNIIAGYGDMPGFFAWNSFISPRIRFATAWASGILREWP